MKKVSAVVLMSMIAFFITTASSASLGKEFQYRADTYGWPNKFLTITYEKAKIIDIGLEWDHLFLDFGFWLVLIGAIRLCLWSMRVKRKIYQPPIAPQSTEGAETTVNA